MKQIKPTVLLIILVAGISGIVYGQETNYGSNSGKHLTLRNTQIYYEEYGSGSPLLLLHGGYGSIHDFQQVIPELTNHFRVIAMDSPGHGRSEQADSLSFELMADYTSEMIAKLKLDSVYIIGYSDGGITALLLASRQPGIVKRVIASGSNSKMSGIAPQVLEYLNMVNPEFIESYQQEWLKDYQNKSPDKENWKKFITDMSDMYTREEIISSEQLSGIGTRVMLVYGDQDVIKLEHGIEMYHTIPGSRFCILPDTPHEVFSANPELINEIGIDFLQE